MRTTADISIYRPSVTAPVYTAPITAQSVRRWKLMEQDCVVLEFNTQSPVQFAIGDYITDEEFGKFIITDEPKPAEFDNNTGAYKYQLQFDREYIGWKNYIFQMTLTGNGYLSRLYTEWSLVDKLETFVQEFERNLALIGYTNYATDSNPRYAYCIDGEHLWVYNNGSFTNPLGGSTLLPSAERFQGVPDTDAQTTSNISFSGADLLSSLKTLCDVYKCEWWVKEITVSGVNSGNPFPILCFGKCKYGTDIDFKLAPQGSDYADWHDVQDADMLDVDDLDIHTADVSEGANGPINVESMTLNRNESTFANRLYVFGGTHNVPSFYRQDLIFRTTGKSLTASGYVYTIDKKITPEMFRGISFKEVTAKLEGKQLTQSRGTGNVQTAKFEYDSVTINDSGMAYYTYNGTNIIIDIYFRQTNAVTSDFSLGAKVYFGNSVIKNIATVTDYDILENSYVSGDMYFGRRLRIDMSSTSDVIYDSPAQTVTRKPRIDVILTPSVSTATFEFTNAKHLSFCTGTFKMNPYKISHPVKAYVNSVEYSATINPNLTENFSIVSFGGGDIGGQFDFQFGQYPDEAGGIDPTQVDLSYYTNPLGDPNAVRLIGENRLMIPAGGPPYIGDTDLHRDKIVEKVVVFDDIYPKCALRIDGAPTQVETQTEVEYEDGSTNKYKFYKYLISAKRIDGANNVNFPFDEKYLSDTEELQIKFITPDEESKYSGGSPRGDQTHGYKLAGMTFSVVWDQTEKTYLINWNETYGAKLPNENLAPYEGDPFILIGWKVQALPLLGLVDSAEQALQEAGEDYLDAIENEQFTFDCNMFSDWAAVQGVLQFGQAVKVFHGALAGGYKESRVIGYELHLDFPFNTPKYTVGETEAYSRLREMERKLNAEERSGSAGATVNGTVIGGGGGSASGATDWYNLIPAKAQNNGLFAIIENYSSALQDSSKYKMFLLRWRRGRAKPHYHSWHAPFFGNSSTDFNAIASADRAWAITSNKQTFFPTTGHTYLDVLPLLKKQREDGTYVFKNSHNRKMRFGCAIYKNTGVGTWGWQRVSNIAVIELFIIASGQVLVSIKP